jgi:aspartyl/asparaginyl beta-hydroxylase (cupin superfamily)
MAPEEPFASKEIVTYKKTAPLAQCPYFEEIVDGFQCPKERVRLLLFEPGTKILTHRDPDEAWPLGRGIRLHIPIVTHDEVYFYVAGQRIFMRPGELWHCDFSRPHRVANRGTIARVHMVIDFKMNDWLRALFPHESWVEQIENWIYRRRLPVERTLIGWGRAMGPEKLKRRLWA